MKNLLQPDYKDEIFIGITQNGDIRIFIDQTKLAPLEAADILIKSAAMIAAQHGHKLAL